MKNTERALQIWQVLAGAAHNRQILTYEILADLIGSGPITVSLTQPLGLLMKYCDQKGLPPITVLVVRKNTGEPGPGLTTTTAPDADREKVFNYKWFRERPLRIEDLEHLSELPQP